MKLQEVLDFISADKGALTGVLKHIQTTDEGKELLQNHATAHFEQNIKSKISDIHSQYDDDVFEVLGERKPNDKKTYEFIKDKLNELKTLKSSKGSDKEQKIKDLQKQIEDLKAEGGKNDYWKRTHDEALSKWDADKLNFEKTIEGLKSKQHNSQVASYLNTGLAGLEFAVPQEAVDAMTQIYSQKVIKNAKMIDGKVVLHNEEGNPLLNSQFKPMSAGEYWKDKLKSIIKSSEQGGGAAYIEKKGNIITVGEGDNAKSKLVLDRSTFSTRHEFNETASKALISKGVEKESKQWNDLIDTARQEYEVSKLPLH